VFCIVCLAVSPSPGFLHFKACIHFHICIVCIRFRLVLQTSRLLESCIPHGLVCRKAFRRFLLESNLTCGGGGATPEVLFT